MRLNGTAAGFARFAGLAWAEEEDEVLPVLVAPSAAGEAERLRLLLVAVALGDVRGIVALESVEFLRACAAGALVGAGASESEPEEEPEEDDSEDEEGRALLAGSVLESLSESLEEEEEEEDEDDEDEEEGEARFLAFFLGEGSASDSESELDEELSELDEELEELESVEAFRFSLFVAGFFAVFFAVFSSSELESEEVSGLDEEDPDEYVVEGGVAFATLVSESLELLLSSSLSSLELASDELTSFCAFC